MNFSPRTAVAMVVLIIAATMVYIYTSENEEVEGEGEADGTQTEEVHYNELTLDNGNKWPVNKATEVGMNNIGGILESWNSNTSDSLNYAELAASLTIETDEIINQCDMTGEAHNQLHFVLHPMLDCIKHLEEAENDSIGQAETNKLSSLLNDYFTHFEYK